MVSCIKRSQLAPSSRALSFSKPLAHLSQPLHIPSHLLLLPLSLYSLLCALGRCQADLTPLSWAFGHQLAHGEVRRMGYNWHGEAWKRFDLNQMADHIRFVLSPTQIMTANSSDPQAFSPSQPADKEQNLAAGETEPHYGDFHAQAPTKGLHVCLSMGWGSSVKPENHPGA